MNETSNAPHIEIRKNLRFNVIVNMLDGGFFGMALGFTSFSTILPLFVSRMTSSAILIGLIPAIHNVGWQIPQLFIARYVAGLKRYKPMTLWMTLNERIPFLGLAAVAWLIPTIGNKTALVLTFILLIWQGLGGGFGGVPWQSMIAKLIPSENRAAFFGFQSAFANVLASFSAVAAGYILEHFPSPLDFTLCFLSTSVCMAISFVMVSLTREPDSPAENINTSTHKQFSKDMISILQRDRNFCWFLVVRLLSQFATMSSAFYIVYAASHFAMSDQTAGLLTGTLMVGQIIANPLMGWIADRWSHPPVLKIGILSAMLGSLMAWYAPQLNWFYLVFILTGVVNVSMWAVTMAMTMEFGSELERPLYIGLANTLVAPATILSPLVGGWLAERGGYPSTFAVSALCALLTFFILQFLVKDPRALRRALQKQREADASSANLTPTID